MTNLMMIGCSSEVLVDLDSINKSFVCEECNGHIGFKKRTRKESKFIKVERKFTDEIRREY